MNWKEGSEAFNFYEKTKDLNPRQLTVKAARLCTHRPAYALDLGCGALRDSRFLIDEGFDTLAVDENPNVLKYAQDSDNSRFQLITSSFQELPLEDDSLDFVSAQYVLSFNPKADVKDLIGRLNTALKPGGVFAANVFGEYDAWNNPENSSLSFYKKSEVENLLINAGFYIFLLEERASNEPTAFGEPKQFWHLYEFIACK